MMDAFGARRSKPPLACSTMSGLAAARSDWMLDDAIPDEALESWQLVMRENAKKAKVSKFIELLRTILGPEELTNLATAARDMDLHCQAKIIRERQMQQWADAAAAAAAAAAADTLAPGTAATFTPHMPPLGLLVYPGVPPPKPPPMPKQPSLQPPGV